MATRWASCLLRRFGNSEKDTSYWTGTVTGKSDGKTSSTC